MKKVWQTSKLGDICVTIQDGAHESPKRQFTEPGPGRFPYVTLKNIRNNFLDLTNVSYVDEDFHNRIYPRCKPGVGDVLLTKDGANTGNVTLNTLDEPFSLLSSVCLIKTRADILQPAFLSYYIQSPEGLKRITGQMTGAAIKRIILRDIKLAEMPLPPLAEQRRIVRALDDAFEGIAIVKANAAKNLGNARAVFDSYVQSVFNDAAASCGSKRLDHLASFKNGLNFNQSSKGQSVEIVGVGDFQENDIVPLSSLSSITIDGELAEDYKLREGDLLTVRSNGSKDLVGRCMIVPELSGILSYSGFIIRIRPDMKLVLPRFLMYFMKSGSTRNRLTRDGGGANISNINQGKLSALEVPVPSLSEQRSVVEKLDSIREETQALESIAFRKATALEALKQSLLREAFSGRL